MGRSPARSAASPNAARCWAVRPSMVSLTMARSYQDAGRPAIPGDLASEPPDGLLGQIQRPEDARLQPLQVDAVGALLPGHVAGVDPVDDAGRLPAVEAH